MPIQSTPADLAGLLTSAHLIALHQSNGPVKAIDINEAHLEIALSDMTPALSVQVKYSVPNVNLSLGIVKIAFEVFGVFVPH